MKDGNHSWAAMIGEALRETAVLVLVFGLLDKVVLGGLSKLWVASTVGLALLTFAIGGIMERTRRS